MGGGSIKNKIFSVKQYMGGASISQDYFRRFRE